MTFVVVMASAVPAVKVIVVVIRICITTMYNVCTVRTESIRTLRIFDLKTKFPFFLLVLQILKSVIQYVLQLRNY